MSNSVFLNYGVSYFDLLSTRIDDNEAEIVDVEFEKINKAEPATPNALLYLTDGTGREVASSSILCQDNNALQNVGCIQLPLSSANPSTVIPELAGLASSTVWLSSENGHLYRGSVDLESGGGSTGDVVGPASSLDNQIALYNGATGKLIKSSLTKIDSSGFISMPTTASGTVMTVGGRTFSNMDRTTKILGYGRNTTRAKTILVGTASTEDSLAIADGIVLGHNSCEIGSGEQSDVIAIGNDIGTASGSNTIVLGNRVCLEPTSSNSLGDANIAIGNDIEIRNSSLSNILLGSSCKVRGSANVIMGEFVFNNQPQTGSNVVIGCEAARNITTSANNNVLIGAFALTNAAEPSSSNILIGGDIGTSITTSVNNCLWLEESGVNGETNTTRIGKSDKQACYISGIYGSTYSDTTQKNLKITSNGRIVSSPGFTSYGFFRYNPGSNFTTNLTAVTNVEIIPPAAPGTTYFSPDGNFVMGSNNARIKYIGTDTVLCSVRYQISCSNSTNSGGSCTFRKNGTGGVSPAGSLDYYFSTSRSAYIFTGWLSLSTNDEVNMFFYSNTTTVNTCTSLTMEILVVG